MQGNCLAMGNRLAVIVANCFVFKLECKLFSILPARPLFLNIYRPKFNSYLNHKIREAIYDQPLLLREAICT